MENKGKVLASGRFKILGEGENFTGKVTSPRTKPAAAKDRRLRQEVATARRRR